MTGSGYFTSVSNCQDLHFPPAMMSSLVTLGLRGLKCCHKLGQEGQGRRAFSQDMGIHAYRQSWNIVVMRNVGQMNEQINTSAISVTEQIYLF